MSSTEVYNNPGETSDTTEFDNSAEVPQSITRDEGEGERLEPANQNVDGKRVTVKPSPWKSGKTWFAIFIVGMLIFMFLGQLITLVQSLRSNNPNNENFSNLYNNKRSSYVY
jgi:hypothetical protein